MCVIRLVAFVCLFAVTGIPGAAQEATPEANVEFLSVAPAHVHAGSCAEPGDVAFPLADAGYGLPGVADSEASPPAVAQLGPAGAQAAMASVTTIEATLDELVAEPHAIDAHRAEPGDEAGTRIACGVVGGISAGDDLFFGLAEVNGSNYVGIAWLRDNGDGTTSITLFLASGLVQGGGTAGGSEAAGEGTAVPAVYESQRIEQAGLIVAEGLFAASALRLLEGVPTVLNVYNTDDQPYYFRIGDLVPTVELPANQLTVVEFTTPTAESYAAMLLADADEAVGLDLLPVIVE
jgi:hypothetical protein